MKLLNLGCGNHFSKSPEWTNIDFYSNTPYIIQHNLLSGIPCEDNTFDFVYHSHVLEHFSKEDGEKFVRECFRVLKPNGILRIAIPDLERIVKGYLDFLEKGLNNESNAEIRANYEWMKIEMYDQTVRNITGGNMLKYLSQKNILNEDFVMERIGGEGRELRKLLLENHKNIQITKIQKKQSLKQKIKLRIKEYLITKFEIEEKYIEIGKFRLGGEIHQWMYDRYSLGYLLKNSGGKEIEVKDAFNSYCDEFVKYELDGSNGVTRKPDSIFMECKKI